MSFENTVGKGEIAHNEQFLLFPQCFLSVFKLSAISIKFEIVVCKLLEFGSLTFVVWETVMAETEECCKYCISPNKHSRNYAKHIKIGSLYFLSNLQSNKLVQFCVSLCFRDH